MNPLTHAWTLPTTIFRNAFIYVSVQLLWLYLHILVITADFDKLLK